MALPFSFDTDLEVGPQNSYHGPFKASDGHFHTILRNTVVATGVGMLTLHESTTDIESWSSVATQQIGGSASEQLVSIWTFQSSDTIHISAQKNNDGATDDRNVYYTNADISGNSIAAEHVIEALATSDDGPAANACSIAEDSSGTDLVVVYQGDPDMVMGTEYARIDSNRTNTNPPTQTSHWDGPVAIDNAGNDHWTGPVIVRGSSNRMHIFFKNDDLNDGFQRTLLSDDSLQTFPSAFASQVGGSTQHYGFYNGISYDDSGTQRVRCPYESTGPGAVASLDSADSPTATGADVTDNNLAGGTATNLASMSVDGTDEHYIYTDNSADILRDINTGSGWGTDTAVLTAGVSDIFSNIYDRSGTKLAYIYDDGGVKYNEVDLGGGPTAGTASFSGTSTFTAAGQATFRRSASYSGTSSFAATGQATFRRTAAFTGVSTFTASGLVVKDRTASFSGTSTFTATGQATFRRTASYTGTSTFTAVGQATFRRSASFSGTSTFTATGLATFRRSASFTGTSTFTADGMVLKLGSASFSGTSTFTASGQATFRRTASYSGVSTFTATGQATFRRTASYSGTSTFTATGLRTAHRTAAFSGTSTFTATGLRTANRAASFSGTSTFTATGLGTFRRSASFSGTSTFTATGVRLAGGNEASFSGTSSFTATGTATFRRTAAYSGTSTFSATGTFISGAAAVARGTSVGRSAGGPGRFPRERYPRIRVTQFGRGRADDIGEAGEGAPVLRVTTRKAKRKRGRRPRPFVEIQAVEPRLPPSRQILVFDRTGEILAAEALRSEIERFLAREQTRESEQQRRELDKQIAFDVDWESAQAEANRRYEELREQEDADRLAAEAEERRMAERTAAIRERNRQDEEMILEWVMSQFDEVA